MLLAAGADVHAKTKTGESALHRASYNGRAAVVEALIAAGADVDAKDNGGQTPGDLAARRGHPIVVALLHDAVADKDGQSEGGKDREGGAAVTKGEEMEDDEETTDDDSVGKAKDNGEAPERAGKRPSEVDVVPPVLVGAADEVPSHVAVRAVDDNWDADTVPIQGEGVALTNYAQAALGAPTGSAVARSPAASKGDATESTQGEGADATSAQEEGEQVAPAKGAEVNARTHQGQVDAATPAREEEAEAAPAHEYLSAAISQGEVKQWLARFLPRILEEDATRYRTRLIADGFDSSEGMTHVREEHVQFMKLGHRLRLTANMRHVPAEELGTSIKRKRTGE
jgi:hypothetical protein